MNPKQKAIELYDKFIVYDWHPDHGYEESEKETKKHALICVDEIINATPLISIHYNYWVRVKKEINKIERL
jgi:hypothetical protein